MTNLYDNKSSIFTFNSTGDFLNPSMKMYTDKMGKVLDQEVIEYGFFNKIVDIKISKLFYLKKMHIGLGDIIDFFTKKLFIKDLIVYLTDGNCGCEDRKIKFNKWVQIPYVVLKSRPLLVNDKEYLERLKFKNLKLTNKKQDSTNPQSFTRKKDGKSFNMNNIKINLNNTNKQQQSQQTPSNNTQNTSNTPVKPDQIRGGCGCRKNKR